MVTVTSEPELVATLAELDAAREPVLVLGGGSNLLVADEGFPGTVVRIDLRGISTEADACSGATLRVAAGEPWDDLVEHTVDAGLVGLEALSGIPGLTGATPIQNVGAYGAEVATSSPRSAPWTGHRADPHVLRDRVRVRLPHLALQAPDRGRRLARTLRGDRGDLPARARGPFPRPVRYPELARKLGIAVGERAPAADVRAAVLALRASKGMVLDEGDHDTWSAGSFFTNPLLSADEAAALPDGAPRFPQPDGRVKTSAAWLIDAAGFGKGFGGAARPAVGKALAGADQPGYSEGERRVGVGSRGAGRRTCGVRRDLGSGACPGGVCAVSLAPFVVWAPIPSAVELVMRACRGGRRGDGGDEARRGGLVASGRTAAE